MVSTAYSAMRYTKLDTDETRRSYGGPVMRGDTSIAKRKCKKHCKGYSCSSSKEQMKRARRTRGKDNVRDGSHGVQS